MHLVFTLLAQRLPNDSLNTFFQTPHLHVANLRWLVYIPVMPDKPAFESSVLLCVQRYQVFFYAPKAAPSGKEWICIFIRTNMKRQASGRKYANVQ